MFTVYANFYLSWFNGGLLTSKYFFSIFQHFFQSKEEYQLVDQKINLEYYKFELIRKMNFHTNSPYYDLLQSKKKVYGHKYDAKHGKSHYRASPGATSIFSQTKRPFKTQSSQKPKLNHSQNNKKKRVNTQAADEKLHQSLCIQMGKQQHHAHHATKSLFYGENKQFANQRDMEQISRWANIFTREQPKQQLKKKKKNSVHVSNSKGASEVVQNAFQSLKITDVESLINLIDNCVAEANEYISYLSQKVEDLKKQLISVNSYNMQLQGEIKTRMDLNDKKDKLIKALESELNIAKNKNSEPTFEIKKLLQVIDKISQENQQLKKYIESNNNILEGFKSYSKSKQDKIKDESANSQSINNNRKNSQNFYKQIHSKIDVFNISIDSKKKKQQGSPDRSKSQQKRYKYIKQKNNNK